MFCKRSILGIVLAFALFAVVIFLFVFRDMEGETGSEWWERMLAQDNMKSGTRDNSETPATTCSELSKENAELKTKIAELEAEIKILKAGTVPMEPVLSPYFCPPEVSDHEKWVNEISRNLSYRFTAQAMFTNRYEASNDPQWFCNKVQNNLEPWIEPKLTPDDFCIGIYTGERIFYSRSSIVVDTWLQPFKHHYLYAALGEPTIPVQDLQEHNLKPEYKDSFTTAYVQLWGLKDMYYKNPNAKWYYIVGCDTFLNVDYMMRVLEDFDPSKDWWITQGNARRKFDKSVNISGWPRYWGGQSRQFQWWTGAVGWFLSNSVMKAYAENIDKFMAENDIRKICYCPDINTGQVLSLLGFKITRFPSKWSKSFSANAVDGLGQDMWSGTNEYVQYHYLSPYKMAMAEHRISHEKLDRIINTGNPNRVVSYFREFIDKHYDVLKRRMRQVKYLARVAKAEIKYRPWDIPCVDPAICKEGKVKRRLLEETDLERLTWNVWDLFEEDLFDDIPTNFFSRKF